MSFSMKQMALITSFCGFISFICGVIAENKMAAAGVPIPGKGVVICKYPSDPTVVLGYISVATLILSAIGGYMSIYYPYNKKSIPNFALFRSKTISIFIVISWITATLAAVLLLWPTITQQFHTTHTVHHNPDYACPTAKTGLLGGGAFLALDSTFFWLVCLMLAANAREDYFEEIEDALRTTTV